MSARWYGLGRKDCRMPFAHPINDRYLEDYVAGGVHKLGSIVVDKGELIDFGRRPR